MFDLVPMSNPVCLQSWDYKKKFPATWEVELSKKLRGHPTRIVCVMDLIDHVITESDAMYAGTEWADSYLLFHDALSLWWTREAQDYIGSRGFSKRQLCCINPTNADTRYEGKLPGDSPEMCRGLDSFGFAHLQRAVTVHTSLTSILPVHDPHRFHTGTVEELWRTIVRCWEVAPSSAQIVDDILGLRRVLERIIEARGAVVPDLFFRSGRRARSKDDSRELDGRKRARQRKETHTELVLHPDCLPALTMLSGEAAAARADAEEEADGEEYIPGADPSDAESDFDL